MFTIHRPRRRRALLVAAVTAAALSTGAQAHAASYYMLVNAQSGRALEASLDGKVRLATPNPTNPLQQWKQIQRVTAARSMRPRCKTASPGACARTRR